ncbi:hypothetical protein ACO0R3_001237 [Hanseniaspora guilliermondii]
MDYLKEQNNQNIDFVILVVFIASVYTYINSKEDESNLLKFKFKNHDIVIDMVDKQKVTPSGNLELAEKDFEDYIPTEESVSSEDEEDYGPNINKESPVVKIISPSISYKESIKDLDLDPQNEIINNEYHSESSIVNLLQNLQNEDDTLDESGTGSEKTDEIDANPVHPLNSKLDVQDDIHLDNSTIKTTDSICVETSTHNNTTDNALSIIESNKQQQPVKILIQKFESISSESSVKSTDNSFINKNILNNAKTKSNETLRASALPIQEHEESMEFAEISNEPLGKELSTPVKDENKSDHLSISSKDSLSSHASNKFFTPLIERNNGRRFSTTQDNDSNFLKFKSGNETINFNEITTTSVSKSVLTQEICATATMVLPEVGNTSME